MPQLSTVIREKLLVNNNNNNNKLVAEEVFPKWVPSINSNATVLISVTMVMRSSTMWAGR
jgi:hypothetical protein